MRLPLPLLALPVVLALVACGGGTSPQPVPVAPATIQVQIPGAPTSLPLGASLTLQATLQGASDTRVDWVHRDPTGSERRYLDVNPLRLDSLQPQGTHTFQALSRQDPTRQATCTLQVTAPASGWSDSLSMTARREQAGTITLQDGRVLVVGGGNGKDPQASAELFDPATRRFTPTEPLGLPRALPFLVQLPSGKVLVLGGITRAASMDTYALPVESFDPATGRFSPTGQLTRGKTNYHAAVLLPDATVLFVGPDGAEVFDPAKGVAQPVGPMATARTRPSATLLKDGRVLVAGGSVGDKALATTELYDPATRTFSPGPTLLSPHAEHDALRLGDGTVLLISGDRNPRCERWNPSTGALQETASAGFDTWGTSLGRMKASLLSDGRALVVSCESGTLQARLFDPATGLWTRGATLAEVRTEFSLEALRDGSALLLGGSALSGQPTHDTARILNRP